MVSTQIVPTEVILQEAAKRLENQIYGRDVIANTLTGPADDFMNKINAIMDRPNELSYLFSAIHFFLTEYHRCVPKESNDDNWPYSLNYDSEVFNYSYFDYDFDVSIMNEKNNGSSFQFYYLVFSFPSAPFAYRIEKIPKSLASICSNNREVNLAKFSRLTTKVGCFFSSFVRKYASKPSSYRKKDFCSDGIMLTSENKKRKRRSSSSSPPSNPLASQEDMSYYHRVYQALVEALSENDTYVNGSILFGSILFIYKRYYFCDGTFKKEGWPVDPTYDSEVLQLWVRSLESTADDDTEDTKTQSYNIFNVSLLRNSKEYFFNIRTVDEKKCVILKLVKNVIPSFRMDESKIDETKVENLITWINFLNHKFIQNTETLNIDTTSSSVASSVSQISQIQSNVSESESGSTSRGVEGECSCGGSKAVSASRVAETLTIGSTSISVVSSKGQISQIQINVSESESGSTSRGIAEDKGTSRGVEEGECSSRGSKAGSASRVAGSESPSTESDGFIAHNG